MSQNTITYPTYIYTLKIVLGLLILLGAIMLFSASSQISLEKFGDSNSYFFQHLKRLFIAFLSGTALYLIDYRKIPRVIIPLYIMTLFVVLIPFIQNMATGQSEPARWIKTGFITIQTAEVVRFTLILYIAAYLSTHSKDLLSYKKGLLPALIMLVIPIVLVALAPDFSTAFMLLIICCMILYVGGIPLKHLAISALPIFVLGFIYVRISDYRWSRVLVYLNRSSDVSGDAYQINQSIISLANGRVFGAGLGKSMLKHLYLPEAHTDFIFSIIGEEWGFLGAVVFIALFMTLFYCLARLSFELKDTFARIAVFGINISIISYALFNIGVTVGIFPVTGLPMPFVSYSGSQIIINGALLGLLFRIIKENYHSERSYSKY
jgi:cell division protein FtsW